MATTTSKTLKSLDKENVKDAGTDKNLLMEYIEKTPIGTKVIPSRYNPIGDRCDA